MKVSSRSRHAIKALVDLALDDRQTGVPINELAEKYGISYSTMELVFSKLRQIGIVKGRRGRDGGYMLARQPHEIAVGEVVSAVEDGFKVAADADAQAPLSEPCHWLWDCLSLKVFGYLQTITLAHLLTELDSGSVSGD